MNKFTPWKVDTVADIIYVRTAKGWTICKIKPDEDDMQNAQLIAAAPMMLDALEIALDLINELATSTQIGYLSDEENKKREAIKAAIRAAKGE